MLRKILIATAAVATLAAASAQQASAKVHINGFINVGVPGGYYVDPYPTYPAYPAYPAGYSDYEGGDDCGFIVKKKKIWNWNHTAYKIVKKKVWICE